MLKNINIKDPKSNNYLDLIKKIKVMDFDEVIQKVQLEQTAIVEKKQLRFRRVFQKQVRRGYSMAKTVEIARDNIKELD